MSVNDESEQQLRAAMERLLAGKPIRSNGSLTVSALAVEAAVSRRTAGRAKGVLRDFHDAMARAGSSHAPATELNRLHDEIAAMRGKLREKNAEVTRLRAQLNTLACRIALLSEENAQLRTSSGNATVVGLPSALKAEA